MQSSIFSFILIGLLTISIGLLNPDSAYAGSDISTIYPVGRYQFEAVYKAKTDDILIFVLDTATGKIKKVLSSVSDSLFMSDDWTQTKSYSSQKCDFDKCYHLR